MKILVIGSGGREHAIIRALKFSNSVSEVHAMPGRVGFSLDEAVCHNVDVNDFEAVEAVVKKHGINCVVVGPEDPLANGLSDYLRDRAILTVAPSKAASQLEASKIYSKEFMQEFSIPTAKFDVVDSVESTLAVANNYSAPYVLKADGLAAGKGVFICMNLDELKLAAEKTFEERIFKEAGNTALLEEFQPGWEMSYLILTNGESYEAMPISQDHKRLGEGDTGPNTGGMGVAGPFKINDELKAQIDKEIVAPTIEGLKSRSLLYRGVLYIGLMITENGPRVIEYNVRFGDPEAQIIMPLLENDWGEVFVSLAKGILPELSWKPLNVACVVLASEGYPDSPKKGVTIKGDLLHNSNSSYFLHAGTSQNEQGDWVTAGGRVLNAVGIGSSLTEAINNSYEQVKFAYWDGYQYRKDIGKKLL